MAAVVRTLVNHCKSKYGKRFEFFYTGSYARNERDITDYDIAIYDNQNNTDDWEDILKVFYNKTEMDGKPIDAQIDQMFKVISRMSGDTLNKSKDEKVYRYIYSNEDHLDNIAYDQIPHVIYRKIKDSLWRKEVFLVSKKHREMGLHKIQRVSREI